MTLRSQTAGKEHLSEIFYDQKIKGNFSDRTGCMYGCVYVHQATHDSSYSEMIIDVQEKKRFLLT